MNGVVDFCPTPVIHRNEMWLTKKKPTFLQVMIPSSHTTHSRAHGLSILHRTLPLRPRPRPSPHSLLRSPSRAPPDLHALPRIHLLPYLHRRTNERTHAWRTS